MALFRKKPVVIEAVQLTQAMMDDHVLDGTPLPPGVECTLSHSHKGNRVVYSARFSIRTLEGYMQCSANDWIITGVKGERYPCKPDIFEATYEPVGTKQ